MAETRIYVMSDRRVTGDGGREVADNSAQLGQRRCFLDAHVVPIRIIVTALCGYVKTNKSDYIDAEAIAEAVGRPTMRFVPIKSDDQLDLQSLHRVRERWVMRRTAMINQIRGLLLERGI